MMNHQAHFTGLTWDHPRGYDALAEAARVVNADKPTPLIHWKKQPLEGFESAPIAQLAAEHDLLVLDHPHLGEAIHTDCLLPLESLYTGEQIAQWSRDCIGQAFSSYQMDDQSWALPLDVATQVLARRADKIIEVPRDWDTVEAIAKTLPVALSLAGPHALLTLMSIAASHGHQPAGADFLPKPVLHEALDLMQRLYARQPAGSEKLNPIQLLECMSTEDSIALVPLVFGYVTYSIPGTRPYPVAFSDTVAPRDVSQDAVIGGVLGGTGIGFTKHSKPSRALLDHIADLLSEPYQRNLIPQYGGQPSFVSAWRDQSVNAGTGNFYNNTMVTAERALLRPRFNGYIKFQIRTSARIRESLHSKAPVQNTIDYLRKCWNASRPS